jgi:hypothetical protein
MPIDSPQLPVTGLPPPRPLLEILLPVSLRLLHTQTRPHTLNTLRKREEKDQLGLKFITLKWSRHLPSSCPSLFSCSPPQVSLFLCVCRCACVPQSRFVTYADVFNPFILFQGVLRSSQLSSKPTRISISGSWFSEELVPVSLPPLYQLIIFSSTHFWVPNGSKRTP